VQEILMELVETHTQISSASPTLLFRLFQEILIEFSNQIAFLLGQEGAGRAKNYQQVDLDLMYFQKILSNHASPKWTEQLQNFCQGSSKNNTVLEIALVAGRAQWTCFQYKEAN
jgi:hypothetical protein